MTLYSFAQKTGWPIEELMELRHSEFMEVIRPFGLTLKYGIKPKKRGECAYCGRNRMTKFMFRDPAKDWVCRDEDDCVRHYPEA